MTREEVAAKVYKATLLSELSLASSQHITHRLLRLQRPNQTPFYAEGILLTTDHGNQFYSAWFQHVCGDALAQKGMASPEPTGDVVEAILGLCQLCTEH